MIEHTFQDVTPDWAKPFVDVDACVIHNTTDNSFCVVDHSIQTTVATSTTVEGCYLFFHSKSSTYCPECGSKRMWDGGGYWCSCDDERSWV